jgi:hypothetical protein
VDFYPYFILSGYRFFYLFELKDIRWSVFFEDNGFHLDTFPFVYQAWSVDKLLLCFRDTFDQNPDANYEFKGKVGEEKDKWEMHIEEGS